MGSIPSISTPPLDSTLSISGKAADAKVVGDKINSLNSSIINLSNGLPKTLEYIGSISDGETF